jgi:hypothetical protein
MAVASVGSGTQTAVVTTEHTLITVSGAGVYVLVVDTNAMVAGDILLLNLKTKDKPGGTSRLAYSATYAYIQTEPHKYSIPIPVDTELIATLTQSAGTSRDFDWNLLKL